MNLFGFLGLQSDNVSSFLPLFPSVFESHSKDSTLSPHFVAVYMVQKHWRGAKNAFSFFRLIDDPKWRLVLMNSSKIVYHIVNNAFVILRYIHEDFHLPHLSHLQLIYLLCFPLIP